MFRHHLWVAIFLAMTASPAYPQQAGAEPSKTQPLSNLTWYAPHSANYESLGEPEILTKLSADQSRIMHDKHVTGKMMVAIYRRWLSLVPEEAKSPTFKKRTVAIELTLYPDGSVHNMRLAEVSGDVALDRAAWEAITGAAKYAPIPAELNVPELRLRFHFVYNDGQASTTQPSAP